MDKSLQRALVARPASAIKSNIYDELRGLGSPKGVIRRCGALGGKIVIEGVNSGFQDRATIGTRLKVALDLALHGGGKPALQVPTD